MTTILFFDDQRLDVMSNVRLRVGQPELIKESLYQDPDVNTHFGFPVTFWNEATSTWRMIYEGRNGRTNWGSGANVKLIAESDDGINWHPMDTTEIIDLDDRRHRHQILPIKRDGRLNTFIDDKGDPEERVKTLVGHLNKPGYMLSSPDGVKWKQHPDADWHPLRAPDPPSWTFWNEIRESYVITTRPEHGDRRITLVETRDWKNFTTPELAMQTDSLDAPLTQIYGMPVFPYEGYYIGLVWLFHCVPEPSNKYLGGHLDCELAYSVNGWHFQRGIRSPFIPNGIPGSPDSGVVYPSSMVRRDDGAIFIYASACTLEHGHTPEGDTGTLVTYKMRKDGFTYVESTGGNGVIGTRTLYWNEGELSLNVQAQGGDVRVQVTDSPSRSGIFTTPPNAIPGYSFDDCIPFSGDNIDWRPTWKDGKTLDALSGKAIRIEIKLNSSRLYAIRGDFVNMLGRQKNAFDSDGTIPQERSGF